MPATTAGSSESDAVPGTSFGAVGAGVVVVPLPCVVDVVAGSEGASPVLRSEVRTQAAPTNARTSKMAAKNTGDRKGKRSTSEGYRRGRKSRIKRPE
jgi:hypothetical protein